jgi:hypothetical protein
LTAVSVTVGAGDVITAPSVIPSPAPVVPVNCPLTVPEAAAPAEQAPLVQLPPTVPEIFDGDE